MTSGREHPRVQAVAIPRDTIVAESLPAVDYADAYRVRLPAGRFPDVESFTRACFAAVPGWVEALMRLRDRIVGVAGLKTSSPGAIQRAAAVRLEPGATTGIFRVYDRTETEILMGEDDRHLDFRVSFLVRESGGARWGVIATVVRFHGWLGRAYFLPVRFFHRLVVPAMLRGGLSGHRSR